MALKRPYNTDGGQADLNNEAHVMGIRRKANPIRIAEHNALATQAERDEHVAKWSEFEVAHNAQDARARGGTGFWKHRIEVVNGEYILDYWNGATSTITYPSYMNITNLGSKLSFITYMLHALMRKGRDVTKPRYAVLSRRMNKIQKEIEADDHWIITSINDLVS